MGLEFDHSGARNDVVSISARCTNGPLSEDENGYSLPIAVAFSPVTRGQYTVGLERFVVTGRLDCCAMHCTSERQKVETTSEDVVEIEEHVDGHKASAAVGAGSMKNELGGSKSSLRRVEIKSQRRSERVTFLEFSSGESPEWRFSSRNYGEPLDGIVDVAVRLEPMSNMLDIRGHLKGDFRASIIITRSNGKPLHPLKLWILRARLIQDCLLHPICLTFNYVDEGGR